MRTLLIEVLVIAIVGALSIGDGIRLVLKEGLQTYDILGPGFYSVGMGVLLIVIGLIYFVSERRKSFGVASLQAVAPSAEHGQYKKTMISMVVAMIAYIVLMDLIGYLFSTLVFFFLINRIVGFRSWLANVGVTAVMTITFYVLFVNWLGIIFPQGMLFDF